MKGSFSPYMSERILYRTCLDTQQDQSRDVMCRFSPIRFMEINVKIDDAVATIERRVINGRITGMKRFEGSKVTIIVHRPDPM